MQPRNMAIRQSFASQQNHPVITTMAASPSYSTTYHNLNTDEHAQTKIHNASTTVGSHFSNWTTFQQLSDGVNTHCTHQNDNYTLCI